MTRRLAAASLPLVACLLAAAPPARTGAQGQEPEVTLPACGIRYPGGYDPNTVGVVEGRVVSFRLPGQGPVSFRLEAAAETYTVLAAPAWYWAELKLEVRDGDRVRVKGSKTMGADGNLYLVAQEIALPGAGQPVALRDASGKPAWSRRGSGTGGHGQRGR